MPRRSNAAEALSYNSSEDFTLDQTVDDEAGLDTVEIDSEVEAITTREDTLRSDVSDILSQIDLYGTKIPEGSRALLERQKEKLLKMLEKGELQKAKDFGSIIAEQVLSEAKSHESLKSKIDQIDLRLKKGFLRDAVSPETLNTIHSLYEQMQEAQQKGNHPKAESIADKITHLFTGESDKKLEKANLSKMKKDLQKLLKNIPEWHTNSLIVAGVEQVDQDEQNGNLDAALHKLQYVIDLVKLQIAPDTQEISEVEKEAIQFLEGITNRTNFGIDTASPALTKQMLSRIEKEKNVLIQLIGAGNYKAAAVRGKKALEKVKELVPKHDFSKKRKLDINKGKSSTNIERPKKTTAPSQEEATQLSGLPDFYGQDFETTIPEDISDNFPSITQRMDLAPEDTQQNIDIASSDGDTNQDFSPNAEATARFEKSRRSIAELSAETRRLNNIVQRATRERNPVQPPPLPEEVSVRTAVRETPAAPEHTDELQLDFNDITIPEKKGLFGRTVDFFFGKKNKEMRAQDRKEKREEKIAIMDREQILSEMLRFDVNLYGGSARNELAKVTQLLRGVDKQKFEPLWNRYLELQKQEKNKWDAAIEKMDFDDITENMKQFGIDIDTEANVATRQKIDELLKESSSTGEIFRKLYGKYVEIVNNNIAALKNADTKQIKSFLKENYGIDATKYLKGDKKETQKVSLLRSEYSQRRRVIDAGITILENESMPHSPAEQAQLRETFPKTVSAVQKIKTIPEITLFLKEQFGIIMDKTSGEISDPKYFNALTKVYEKETKAGKKESARALELIDAAIERAEKLAKGRKFNAAETFVGKPDAPESSSE